MECFICKQKIDNGYLCEMHANELKEMLDNKVKTFENPDWKYHCLICGEHQERVIVEYPNAGYFCDKDIIEEWERYNKDDQ